MNVYERLMKVQTGLKVEKNRQSPQFKNYRYRNAEDILTAAKPFLAEVGAVITLSDEPVVIGDWHYIKATATFLDLEGGVLFTEAYARESLSKQGNDPSQVTGSASTYARKYALNGLLLMDDGKDPDSENQEDGASKASGSRAERAPRQKSAPKPEMSEQEAMTIKVTVPITQADGTKKDEDMCLGDMNEKQLEYIRGAARKQGNADVEKAAELVLRHKARAREEQ